MSEAPLILGVSGLRGIVGESLTPEVAVRYAAAFGNWIGRQQESWGGVVVARDGRAGGELIYHAVIAGLIGSGCQVMPIGVATTPTVGVAVDEFGYMGALIVTASHNPQEWNGIKALVFQHAEDHAEVGATTRAPSSTEAEEIIGLFKAGARWSPAKYIGSLEGPENAVTKHLLRIHQAMLGLAPRGRVFRVVLDSVNTSGAAAAMELLRTGVLVPASMRHDVVQLHGDGSGIFPHTPEPTKENLSGEGGLCDAVPGLKADVGFAQDPDADRLAVVDEQGSYIGEEYTLVLCAAALMEARKEEGRLQVGPTGGGKPVFVVNLSTSRMIDDVAAHYGAEVVRTPVGEANVVERMKQLKMAGRDVVMGGEGNGGVIWPEVTYVRDSLSAMALTLALMARTGKKVSELVAMVDAMGPGKKGYCILKRKAPLASKADAVPVVEHLTRVYRGEGGAAVDTQDGVRIDWPARGVWAHVRASNTEPIMRVIVEAPTEALATETAKAVEARIAEV
jgi:phosphomannomutase